LQCLLEYIKFVQSFIIFKGPLALQQRLGVEFCLHLIIWVKNIES